MNDRSLHSTLRRLHALARQPRIWVLLAVVSLIVGMIGPFGTFDVMPPVPRIAYWAAIVVVTGATGMLISTLVEGRISPRLPNWAGGALGGALAGPLIALEVTAINLATLERGVAAFDFLTLVGYCVVIAAALCLLAELARGPGPETISPPQPASISSPEPALLDRLPRSMRGRLLHLAVADHYVDVTTEKGTTLVLMRLSDAMRETAPVEGLQVHRSHWVALDAVRRGVRRDGKPVLELESGTLVPVSRSYVAAAREKGLLG